MEIEKIMNTALYENYLHKLEEFRTITGKEYHTGDNTWYTKHTPFEAVTYADTNTLTITFGMVKYLKHNPMGHIVESFEFNLSEYRTLQIEKILW